MVVHSPGDVLVADSGIADDTYDSVTAARFAPSLADQRVAEIAALVGATGRPFSWWVGPASTRPGCRIA